MISFPAPEEDGCRSRERNGGRTSRDISHSDRQNIRDAVRGFGCDEKRHEQARDESKHIAEIIQAARSIQPAEDRRPPPKSMSR